MTVKSFRLAGVCFLILTASVCALAQRDNSIHGQVKINVKGSGERATPPQATVILFLPSGKELALPTGPEYARQTITSGGRYRFTDLGVGEYELAVEIDHQEVLRTRLFLSSLHAPYGLQYDLEFDLEPIGGTTKTAAVSAADVRERTSANKRLFKKAEDAVVKQDFDQAISLLKQMVASDKADYQAQAILGTLLGSQGKYDEAEQAYLSALSAKPTFAPALIDFGRLRLKQKRFADAVEPLTKLVGLQPDSGEANLLLGDAYAQMNQRAKAIPYLNEAARLGYPQAHLRLAWIYDADGAKDKAALEYEEFLKKKPDYPDRPKLEAYIKANKKN
jgi:tetratricopeptide (TPR) repeat protein